MQNRIRGEPKWHWTWSNMILTIWWNWKCIACLHDGLINLEKQPARQTAKLSGQLVEVVGFCFVFFFLHFVISLITAAYDYYLWLSALSQPSSVAQFKSNCLVVRLDMHSHYEKWINREQKKKKRKSSKNGKRFVWPFCYCYCLFA